jgi:hypothetical protein
MPFVERQHEPGVDERIVERVTTVGGGEECRLLSDGN